MAKTERKERAKVSDADKYAFFEWARAIQKEKEYETFEEWSEDLHKNGIELPPATLRRFKKDMPSLVSKIKIKKSVQAKGFMVAAFNKIEKLEEHVVAQHTEYEQRISALETALSELTTRLAKIEGKARN